MLTWNDVHTKITKTSNEFSFLQSKFNKFFEHIESQINRPALKLKNIQIHKNADAFFTSTFAGRDLTFVFTTRLNGSGPLTGHIACYMQCKFPENKLILIGSFEFSTSGKTTLIVEENDCDPAQLDHDGHALCIFLEILYKSLSY